ncbi:MAG TPA: outer membrane beta-barrel protein [Candidatus Acidoferrum sp.]|nr:outer membrane beta-barrel protein [Candidatus Acidoferrum sp.]
MKKIVASVGMIALGATSVQALDSGMVSDNGRFWSVSASLRGFYDDNINTLPNNATLPPGYYRDSWGFEVSPAIFLSFPLDQTSIGLSYVYDFKYYENKPLGQSENYDMTHVFNVAINHAFSERYQISVKDSFALGQEPDLLRAGNTYNTFQRIPGDNLRNYGVINFSAQLTPLFGLELGYANTLFKYADHTVTLDSTGNIVPSTAGLLNTMDQTVHLDGRFQIQPQTIGVIGYQFRSLTYTEDQPIGGNVLMPFTLVKSDIRNVDANYGYIGLDHNFRPDLTGSFRLGGAYNDYVNNSSQNNWSPYALVSLRYTYNPGSYFEAGFTYDFTSGNNFSVAYLNNSVTMGAYAASLYGSLHHQITGKLAGTLMVQYQNDQYYGGTLNNQSQEYFLAYIGLSYQFNPYISAEIGYDYDNVWGDIPQQNYDRNRVYLGVTASY